MLPGLNYDEKDPRFILLGKVFKFVENEKAKDIFNRNGVKNRSMFLICLKIFFMQAFFSYTISEVINELERSRKLRIFTGIHEVPEKGQVYELLNRYEADCYCKIVNSLLNHFLNRIKDEKTVI